MNSVRSRIRGSSDLVSLNCFRSTHHMPHQPPSRPGCFLRYCSMMTPGLPCSWSSRPPPPAAPFHLFLSQTIGKRVNLPHVNLINTNYRLMTSLLTLQLKELKVFTILDHLLNTCMNNIENVVVSSFKFLLLFPVSL